MKMARDTNVMFCVPCFYGAGSLGKLQIFIISIHLHDIKKQGHLSATLLSL